MIEINEQTTTKVEYPKNCYSCKRCLSGTYQIEKSIIDEGTLICELTGNVLVEPDGTEVNITACDNYKQEDYA
jgi:hypothetical protein